MKERKIAIKNRWTGSIMFEYSSIDNTLAKKVVEALKSGANLRGANLRGADLRGADLYGANLRNAKGGYMACPSDGSFVGWKKAAGMIVKLQIPENARCDKALVLEIQNLDGTDSGKQAVHSTHDPNFVYTVGATVGVPDFDDNRWNECAPGIHFFIDRRAAVEY